MLHQLGVEPCAPCVLPIITITFVFVLFCFVLLFFHFFVFPGDTTGTLYLQVAIIFGKRVQTVSCKKKHSIGINSMVKPQSSFLSSFKYGAPLYGVAWPEGNTFYVCGGGGSTASGIKNRWVCFHAAQAWRKRSAQSCCVEQTGWCRLRGTRAS